MAIKALAASERLLKASTSTAILPLARPIRILPTNRIRLVATPRMLLVSAFLRLFMFMG